MEQKYELYHHGILGMKWGIRRYQNKDGSLTPLGRKRYSSTEAAEVDRYLNIISEARSDPEKTRHMPETGVFTRSHNKKAEELNNTISKSHKEIQKIFDNISPDLKHYRDQREEIQHKIDILYEECKNEWLKKHGGEYPDYFEAEAFYEDVACRKDKKYITRATPLYKELKEIVDKSNILAEKAVDDMLGSIGNESINSGWTRQQIKMASKYGIHRLATRSKKAEIRNIIGPYGESYI